MIPTKKILMIDDDEINNFLVSEWTKMNYPQFDLRIITDASSAIRYLETCLPEEFPELIICDLLMPDYDGFDFLHLYETIFYNNNLMTRIIVLSANVAEKDIQKLKAYACLTEVLVKKTAQENFKFIQEKYLN